jgi:uroporphyrinogen-III decarboxylase
MKGDVIEICISIDELAERETRIATAKRFETPDRIPVLPAINTRYWLPKIGVSFGEYFADPETMLRSQILGHKWLMENIHTDQFNILGSWGCGWTDFQNCSDSGSLGCEVIFPPDHIPWVSGKGWVKTEKDLRQLEKIDFISNGLNLRQVEYRHKMIEISERYPVRFQGGPIFYPGQNPALTLQSNGPFTIAADLMGEMEICTALYDRPNFVNEILTIITDKILQWLEFCWDEMQIPNRAYGFADDLACTLSPNLFRDFVLPYHKKIFTSYPEWKSLHMCGKTDHLLKILADELEIDEFNAFGYQTNLDLVAKYLGGKVFLIGNVNPLVIASGTPEQVRIETLRVIEKLAEFKGLMIMDGANIAPESPVRNINAMMETAHEFGEYEGF